MAKNESVNRRTKHIDVRYHYTRQAVQEKQVRLMYCPTADMVADILTKPLGKTKLVHFVHMIGLRKAVDVLSM